MVDYSMPKDIAEFLEDASVGTVGTDIFVGQMPDSPDNCITVYQYAGQKPQLGLDLEEPGLQIRVRNTSWAAAMTLAKSIYDLLHEKTWDTTMESGKVVYFIEATGSMAQGGKDPKGLYHVILNFTVTRGA